MISASLFVGRRHPLYLNFATDLRVRGLARLWQCSRPKSIHAHHSLWEKRTPTRSDLMMATKYSLMTCWTLQNGAFLDYAVLILLTTNPLASAVTRELPNTYPFIVQKEYIEAFVEKWDEPAHTL